MSCSSTAEQKTAQSQELYLPADALEAAHSLKGARIQRTPRWACRSTGHCALKVEALLTRWAENALRAAVLLAHKTGRTGWIF
jgi:hypothetical protein